MTLPIQNAQEMAKRATTFVDSRALRRTPKLTSGTVDDKRKEIALYFTNTFDTYTGLFDVLRDDAGFYQKPIPLRHPLIFYLGHTATFFINKLLLAKLIPERIDAHMESIFAVGVDEMSWDDLSEDNYDWPSVSAVKHYRTLVRAKVLKLINTLDLALPIDWENTWWPIVMGIEHERIHLKPRLYLFANMNWLRSSPYLNGLLAKIQAKRQKNKLISVPAGSVSLGKSFDSAFYGWDNEYGQHQADVAELKPANI